MFFNCSETAVPFFISSCRSLKAVREAFSNAKRLSASSLSVPSSFSTSVVMRPRAFWDFAAPTSNSPKKNLAAFVTIPKGFTISPMVLANSLPARVSKNLPSSALANCTRLIKLLSALMAAVSGARKAVPTLIFKRSKVLRNSVSLSENVLACFSKAMSVAPVAFCTNP